MLPFTIVVTIIIIFNVNLCTVCIDYDISTWKYSSVPTARKIRVQK